MPSATLAPTVDYSQKSELDTASPLRKPAGKWIPQRDNCEARVVRTGRPGSKRYQRFLNKMFLFECNEEVELDPLLTNRPGAFSMLFRSPDREAWAAYMDHTDECAVEDDAIRCLVGSVSSIPLRRRPLRDQDVNGGLGKQNVNGGLKQNNRDDSSKVRLTLDHVAPSLRKVLFRFRDSTPLIWLNGEVRSFADGSSYCDKSSLSFSLDPFLRLLCHSVCQFYRVSSRSEDTDCGERVVTLRRPRIAISSSYPSLPDLLRRSLS